jgi:hypothetical protein
VQPGKKWGWSILHPEPLGRQLLLPTNYAPERRFPPPWSASKLERQCFIVPDANGQALTYLLTRDEARRIAANIAKDAGPRHSLVIVSGLSR